MEKSSTYREHDPVLAEDLELIARDACVDWPSLRDCTVLVTGATGYIGSLLIKTLAWADQVHALHLRILVMVRNVDKANAVLSPLLDCAAVKLIVGDITDPLSVDGPVDYILHAAAVTTSRLMVEKPFETIRTTLRGTESVLALAHEKHAKGMVYLSSMEVYGTPIGDDCKMSEEKLGFVDPLQPRSSYPESKRMAEGMCAAAWHQYGTPVTIARLAQTFGAGVPKNENRVFAQFARAVMAGEDIVLKTDGSKAHCYCYSRDAIAGLLMLLTKGCRGEAYNLSNEATFCNIREMAERLIAAYPESGTKLVFDIPADASVLGYPPSSKVLIPSDKARGLGWMPTVGLEEMYERLMRSLKDAEECHG